MRKTVLYLVLGILFFPSFLSAQNMFWFKGNTHCHTINSDGDKTPQNVVTDKGYTVEIQQEDDMEYTTQFIGKNGQILKEVFGTPALYTFQGGELYVRARILSSSGEFACTQPFFIKKDES
ncbi:MAG TPA: hypothetical protein VMW92_05725 [Candidatus Heimdallarchaeota archaeon]|nr:hypothetical protein [Candidatus Heimdallarchaeota archaeon]